MKWDWQVVTFWLYLFIQSYINKHKLSYILCFFLILGILLKSCRQLYIIRAGQIVFCFILLLYTCHYLHATIINQMFYSIL